MIIMARKVTGPIPLDSNHALWKSASFIDVLLAPQVMAKPRVYTSEVEKMRVKALHNAEEIAFLVQWDDRSRDASEDLERFSDAVALEFPSTNAKKRSHFAMGDVENTVNIWFWKAVWEESPGRERVYAVADDFLGGVQAGNPLSKPRTSPVENMIAQGFGSATDMERTEGQPVSGSGKWQSHTWSVVFRRSLTTQNEFEVRFREGGVVPVSFAVWNGSEKHRGGRKAISTWYYVGMETETPATVYLYPLLTFLGTGALLIGLVFVVRKRKMPASS
jgi:complex iron-sulfur molybdoenzyme family reductase subunit gamma